MRLFQLASIAALTLAFAFTACKKDEKTKTEILTSKNWKLTALTVNPPIINPITQTSFTDAYALLQPCETDNLFIFKANNTGIIDEGPTKCSSSAPQTEIITWAFNSTETVLTFHGEDHQIVELTEKKIVTTYTENFLGTTFTYTATFE